MEKQNLEPIEIYPNILVYKNMFRDIQKSYKILTDSLVESEDRLFSPWTKWSHFGEYLSPIFPSFNQMMPYANIKELQPTTITQKEQQDFFIEMLDNFFLVTEDYINRNNIEVDKDAISIDEQGYTTPTWQWSGGSIGKYHVSDSNQKVGMNYHSDYTREQRDAPGYKFVITCTIYFNDDYEGGEVDFVMGDKLVKYKPEAGDMLVFP
jgi:hypothetical protein